MIYLLFFSGAGPTNQTLTVTVKPHIFHISGVAFGRTKLNDGIRRSAAPIRGGFLGGPGRDPQALWRVFKKRHTRNTSIDTQWSPLKSSASPVRVTEPKTAFQNPQEKTSPPSTKSSKHDSINPKQLKSRAPRCGSDPNYPLEGLQVGGVKQGRFVILRFPFFCSVWGFQNTQMLGKNSTKSVIVTPLFVCPKC